MAKQQKVSAFVSQAQAAAATRFDSQGQALLGLLREAANRRADSIAVAKSTARGTQSVIAAARPQLQRVYADAGFKPGPVVEPVLPAGPANFQSAQAYEQAAAQRALGRQASSALGGLETQKIVAAQGGTFGALQADRAYQSDAAKIGDEARALAAQKGDFAASTLLGLTADARKREAALRLERRQAGRVVAGREDQQAFQAGQSQLGRDASVRAATVADQRRQAAAARKATAGSLPGGFKVATPIQHQTFKDAVAKPGSTVSVS